MNEQNSFWEIGLKHLRYDKSDIEYQRANGNNVPNIGDIMSSDVSYLGPISIDHNHWTGYTLTISVPQAEWIKRACEAYEKIEPFPEQ